MCKIFKGSFDQRPELPRHGVTWDADIVFEFLQKWSPVECLSLAHHLHHQSLNREGRWGTTDDFATSFLHFFLFSTALWDLPNSRPVHSLMLSSHLFLCFRLVFFPLSLCLARWFWPDLMNGRHDHTTAVCASLRSSGDLHMVQLPAGSWHGLPRW